MNVLFVALAIVAVDPSLASRVKRYAEGYQRSAVPAGKVDRLSGLDCVCAFMIHPKTERSPQPIKQSLRDWARSQNWRGRLVVMEFADEYGSDEKAKRFMEQWPTVQGGQSMNLRAVRLDTTVIWGDGDAIERARR